MFLRADDLCCSNHKPEIPSFPYQRKSPYIKKMTALLRLFNASPSRNPPQLFESDEIHPVHMLDDTKTLRGIIVTWTLRFNDVLDADKLNSSLSRLLEIGDWRKLGGRLRLNVRLEELLSVDS
jgi:hypothetical protein